MKDCPIRKTRTGSPVRVIFGCNFPSQFRFVMAVGILRRRHGLALAHIDGIDDVAVSVDYFVRSRFRAYVAAMQFHDSPPLSAVCVATEKLYPDQYGTAEIASSQKQVSDKITR